ncbi:tRNA (N6-threonylcarbamoyladenosine(37)-N6)-methyltransferase TrmO [Leptolyngbya cf. ectocarpi LEGE 11479]|uniref:tRNA (N6-threonylcarbamoyladenosine(37)-N6)-methyltransferase TrmO n=1 Tax=Leptolyngbya cf. ectocarpi LEGE 11479 TaxID=1828722 RepID=A0A928ZQR5_LEPEC|nr:tRNA (N6-threonylcarbamoyladenosine(37)-N6)-methyltransferase TrmO [Leptolyngbya ectocarpi]MBE9066520.1 tRNA (N6-threonylcarbamoyladenosine(37)-N6)-methyltransferase TrmO [Leptolyngbya cf. ectocarpi LEGE 11479]
MVAEVTFTPIAHIQSCYPDRFGIPRQAGLVASAYADIVFDATEENKLALRGLEDFSHLWVLFVFHGQTYGEFKPLVRPPRLGGNKSVGVYGTRSPNRPNAIGMSAVRLLKISERKRKLRLEVQGGDFLDGTPVIDIKPYVPYADAIAEAEGAWTVGQETPLPVCWSAEAEAVLMESLDPGPERLRCLIEETLGQDPRPGYKRGKDGRQGQRWHMQLGNYSLFWRVENGTAEVIQLEWVER